MPDTTRTTSPAEPWRIFAFGRDGNPKVDPVGEFVHFARDGREYLGEVVSTFRDEDETLRATVKHFNGEPWPIDPAVGCLGWIRQVTT